jgi:hypothetical protein
VISGNRALGTGNGVGVVVDDGSTVTMSNVTVSGNTGSGIVNLGTLANVLLSGNPGAARGEQL